uniref:Uncharacterized protein n=1 Tax=Fagus sylvatica TaxID=28930 RepID=A0A2N9EZI9_FAGSY
MYVASKSQNSVVIHYINSPIVEDILLSDDGVSGIDLGSFSEEQDAPPGFNVRNHPIEVNDDDDDEEEGGGGGDEDEDEEEENENEYEDDNEDGGGGGGFGVHDDIDFNYVL